MDSSITRALNVLDTEKVNPATTEIDRMSPLEIVQVINAEDAKVALAVQQVLPQIARAVAEIATRLRRGGRLIYVGAGTSGRLGALDASECPPTFNIPQEIVLACNENTPLEQEVEIIIAPLVGPEVISGSTRLKAGTAQKMVLNMLSTGTMILLGKTFGNLMVDVQATNYKLQQRALSIVRQASGLDENAARTLLETSGGEAKTAILAARANISPEQARERLAAHDYVLRAALEDEP
ncbi:MAG TPA: N-acetylmuramic acid 6-phosphate etherase [Ktedonobacteraceae bacterium]|nr:N-acetylmuramic acid 6-phosphate etherase [Ktedonobacteraceae bacterium]